MLQAPRPRMPSGSSTPSSSSSGRSSPVSEAFSGFSVDSDVSSSNTSTSSLFDPSCTRHDRLGAWFLGPKAENIGFLKQFLNSVADETERARLAYQPDDPKFIGKEMQSSTVFKKEMSELDVALKELVGALAEHSIPFWSPRYNAHMNGDTSLPGMLGYLAAAMFNPNNVCTESSPLTTVIERDVGLQLCQMLGYDISNTESSKPWGHIVCGGSVANLESMWSARNLKFYPLSVACAMEPGAPLDFMSDEFSIELCNGEIKLFSQATAWELLNLKPETVFDIPERLQNEYAISAGALSAALGPYLIQTCGKEVLEQKFNMKPCKYFVGTTKHYSWPKGAAVTGIGSEHILDVPVDIDARMDISKLDQQLHQCLVSQTPVFAVVAVMGSTEHGAVDPIKGVVQLRTKYQALGLSFAIHADAAWGGYYASFLHEPEVPQPNGSIVPEQALSDYTRSQLEYLRFADSITIDPHKSGYIPYPAGGLCYRDGRMRYLVTWTNPNVYKDSDGTESMGVYGIEGSKPGASAVGAWLSHRIIGLHKHGYGSLLGESLFSCTKIYTHWATMDMDDNKLIVVPLKAIPAERQKLGAEAIRKQREYIRDNIVNRTNDELMNDAKAMDLLHQMVSDLSINAFACNFRLANGEANSDVVEANYLNTRIYERLSVTKVEDNIYDKPLFIQSSQMNQQVYGVCADLLKSRLGVSGEQDLDILVNCVMSPFPTVANFTKSVTDEFKRIAHEEIQTCLFRNTVTADDYKFILQGTDKLYLSMLPQFNHANFRHQLILTCEVPEDVMESYREAKKEDPSAVFMLSTASPVELTSILAGSFKGVLQKRLAAGIELTFSSNFEVSNVQVIKNKPLDSKYLDLSYSNEMYFYLYGTPSQQHIEHILVASKNVQLTSDQVTLDLSTDISEEDLARGVLVRMDRLRESVVLPVLPPHTPTFFRAGAQHKVTVFRDPHSPERCGPGLTEAYSSASPIATGTIKFGEMVYTDSVQLNSNPLPKGVVRPKPKDVSRMTLSERLDAARANMDRAPKRSSPQPIIKKRHVVNLDHNALVSLPAVKAGFNGLFFMMMCLFVLATVVYRPF
ncbi:pyridoxal-dependent decarboxylase domain protein [Rhizoctonia solani 123E]|uniref:Pyridoxal-dependent decarboxylase domain protein n=1 Tax=Rhizoctonia solani 123E TaxID=1423351 RepID=A0A074RZJ5_9AGAM|nr:pyridoxal-dependent decarboxylase domain protein [Rhizoctonia solani 123E]